MYAEKAGILYIWIIHIICCMNMRQCHTAKKKRYVQWWHHQQYICILYQRKKNNSAQQTAMHCGVRRQQDLPKQQHTRNRQHSMREALAPSTAPRSGTTHNSKCLRFATCTNCINYVSVQCRCNDALSLFASFAYHLWKNGGQATILPHRVHPVIIQYCTIIHIIH